MKLMKLDLASIQAAAKPYQAALRTIYQKTEFQVAKEFLRWIIVMLAPVIYFVLSWDLSGFYFWVFIPVFGITLALLVFLVVRKGHTWVGSVGWWILFVLTWLATWGIWLRLRSPIGVTIAVGAAGFVSWMIWKLREEQYDRLFRIRLKTALVGIPLLAGWLLSSTLHFTRVEFGFEPYDEERSILQLDSSAHTRFEERQRRLEAYPGVTVAVALSGGGYRAAAIHAGVLRALDKLGVPIHYLSTVSGGSIIGGFYSLGYAPEQ